MERGQGCNNTTVTTGAASVEALPTRTGNLERTQLIITNTSAAAVVTIAKGDVLAVAGSSGIRLQPNSSYVEATDGGYVCWQGAVQVVSDVAGSIGITESFVEK